jgi:hypothetical protein
VRRTRSAALACAALALGLSVIVSATRPAHSATGSAVSAGEAIYRRGVLPSGAPLVGQREGSSAVEGAEAACMRCHRRSGLGAIEGRSSIPPISALYLMTPRGHGDASTVPVVDAMRVRREPYTEETLARAIHEGLGPDGRPLSYLMPRFALDDAAMAELIAYLKALNPRAVPGVEPAVLHFATIITPDADPVKRQAMLDVLTQYFSDKNAAYRNVSPQLKSSRRVMFRVARRWQLHVWELSGAPATWEAQLVRDLEREPVFAVISGLGGRSWAPVHRFCEHAQLPCLLPNVELPDTAPGDVYTVYFSKGVLLEAELIAHDLGEPGTRATPRRVVQVFRADDVGEAAAAAFAHAIGPRGIAVVDHRLPAKAGGLPEALAGVGAEDAVVLWLRPRDLSRLAQLKAPTGSVYVSGLMGDLEDAPVPAAWRERTRMAYLHDLPAVRRVRVDYQIGWLVARKVRVTALQLQSDTFLACGLLAETLGHMVDTFQRDYLVERLDDQVEHRVLTGYYPHLSLSIGQSFASKGGYIVHFAEAQGTKLVRDSDWIVP